MPQTKNTSDAYEAFAAALKTGQIGTFYILHGEERYLLENSLVTLRKLICPDGLGGFNYKRFEGRDLTADDLSDAIDMMPVFAERTLIEVHDFDIFANIDRKEQILRPISDLPEYVCLVLIYDTVPYKPDTRTKLDKDILKYAQVVEFCTQEQTKLIKWIFRHIEANGKTISKADAEYLALITDGLMTTLDGEIEKVSAFSKDPAITRSDIDAVVVPTLDAVAYQLTDAILAKKHNAAMSILDELLRMREAPQKILFSISLKLRQLLAARAYLESSKDKSALMKTCDIRYEFQARNLIDTARKVSLAECRDAVLACADAALALNSESEPESRLIELIARLAFL